MAEKYLRKIFVKNMFCLEESIGIKMFSREITFRETSLSQPNSGFKQNLFIASGFFFQILKLIVPTFDTKVTEYLCSGGFFFLQTNFDFLTSHF